MINGSALKFESSLLRRRSKTSRGSHRLEGAAVGASSPPGKLNSHERPSLWFRSFRVKLPPRRDVAPDSRRMAREFRGRIQALSETRAIRLLTPE
jgi:hypothetical protein